MTLYATCLRPLLFRLEAERAHRLAIGIGARLGAISGALRPFHAVRDARLTTEIAGLHFDNPVGLAAGFDKSGTAIRALAGLGFGSIEIGSVSLDASDGNPPPRLFRLPADRAIVVHYGLPNDGADAVADRLAATRMPVPLGINIVKTNRGKDALPETPAQIIDEYMAAARSLAPAADYLMFNLSCPNTADGRDFFADAVHLRDWLSAMAGLQLAKPVFLKVSPLGGVAAIEQLLEAVDSHHFVRGFMFNLPPVKPDGMATPAAVWGELPGAVSGPPAAALADYCLSETYRRMDRRRYALFGAGGVFTAEDAYAKIRRGASLVQLLTALVYEGPGVVRRINTGLAQLLRRDGFTRVADAVGADIA